MARIKQIDEFLEEKLGINSRLLDVKLPAFSVSQNNVREMIQRDSSTYNDLYDSVDSLISRGFESGAINKKVPVASFLEENKTKITMSDRFKNFDIQTQASDSFRQSITEKLKFKIADLCSQSASYEYARFDREKGSTEVVEYETARDNIIASMVILKETLNKSAYSSMMRDLKDFPDSDRGIVQDLIEKVNNPSLAPRVASVIEDFNKMEKNNKKSLSI